MISARPSAASAAVALFCEGKQPCLAIRPSPRSRIRPPGCSTRDGRRGCRPKHGHQLGSDLMASAECPSESTAEAVLPAEAALFGKPLVNAASPSARPSL